MIFYVVSSPRYKSESCDEFQPSLSLAKLYTATLWSYYGKLQ